MTMSEYLSHIVAVEIRDYLIYHEGTGTLLDGDAIQLFHRGEYDVCMVCDLPTDRDSLDDDCICSECAS